MTEGNGGNRVRVACDVGGTFTDICVLDEATGRLHVAKVPSTADPIEGVLQGVAGAGVDLRDVALFAHGTTLATNALITRNFPPVVMVTTKGFRDVLEIRRGNRDDLWDTYKEIAPPYIRRRDRLVVTERVDYSGAVVTPLDENEARDVARVIKRRGVTNVAVCFVNAFVNPDNERRMKEILAGGDPGGDYLNFERCASRDLRARALLDNRGKCRSRTGGRRVRARSRKAPAERWLRGGPACSFTPVAAS